MDKIKKIILFRIPMSVCNLRCHYCYLGQRPVHFEGKHPEMKYTPEEVGQALTKERLGGLAYTNFCADGETLLVKDIDKYVRAVVEQGHYAEVVTNLTVTPVLEKFLSWPKDLIERVEFKCSFHYLELKAKNKLELFADNVRKIWAAGGSANIEITPSDELIPYLDAVKEFSMRNFGALPHLSIARDDNTEGIDYLTKLPMEEYDRIWSSFDSGFWKFKKTIFGKKRTGFCYAGRWGCYIDLSTGFTKQCYCGAQLKNAFDDKISIGSNFVTSKPIGRCQLAHCYNGHMLLTLGYIPGMTDVRYGDIRDREMDREIVPGRRNWLNPKLKAFFNTKLEESNEPFNAWAMAKFKLDKAALKMRNTLGGVKYQLLNRGK